MNSDNNTNNKTVESQPNNLNNNSSITLEEIFKTQCLVPFENIFGTQPKNDNENNDEQKISSRSFLKLRDDGWEELYAKIQKEKKENNLSISQFLISCGLSPYRSYFQQLCSNSNIPSNISPSNKEGSLGREFRDAVNNYFEKIKNNGKPIQKKEIEFSRILSDWRLDNYCELQCKNISDIFCSKKNNYDIIVHVYQNCTLQNEDIIKMLMSDNIIKNYVEKNNAKLQICSRVPCALL